MVCLLSEALAKGTQTRVKETGKDSPQDNWIMFGHFGQRAVCVKRITAYIFGLST